jgi:hypothetical protein
MTDRAKFTGGGYDRVEGKLSAHCTSDERRTTVRLEHGGESESWKRSEETECSYGRWLTLPIAVTGHLKPGERLELRMGSWPSNGFIGGSMEHTDRQQ